MKEYRQLFWTAKYRTVDTTQGCGSEKNLRITVSEPLSGLKEKEILTINWMFHFAFIFLSLHKLPKSREVIAEEMICFVPYITVGWEISRNDIYKQKYGLLNQTILTAEHNLQFSLTLHQYFVHVILLEPICSLAFANMVCQQTTESSGVLLLFRSNKRNW